MTDAEYSVMDRRLTAEWDEHSYRQERQSLPAHLLTAPEAAAVLNIGRSTIRKALASGALATRRYGRDHLIERAVLDRWNASRRGRGRPPKPPKLV